MTASNELTNWLERINRRFASEDLPHDARPFHALSEYTAEHNCTLSPHDPIAETIFQWFYAHSSPGAHHVGSLYQGVLYYDAAFWPISIPITVGKPTISCLDCLTTMPSPIKSQLSNSSDNAGVYASHWMNCMDYAYGYFSITQTSNLKPKTLALLAAADGDLRGAMSQLLERPPIGRRS